MTLNNIYIKAIEAGYNAAKDGKKAIPAQCPDFCELTKNLKVGKGGVKIAKKWLQGFVNQQNDLMRNDFEKMEVSQVFTLLKQCVKQNGMWKSAAERTKMSCDRLYFQSDMGGWVEVITAFDTLEKATKFMIKHSPAALLSEVQDLHTLYLISDLNDNGFKILQ